MDLNITGRTAIVLGAGGGLGGAIAESLAREGVQVAALDRSREGADSTTQRIREAGGAATSVVWDLTDLDGIPRAVDEVERTLGPVDILINMTGGPAPSPAQGQEPQVWRDAFEMMFLSVVAITDRVLPGMKDRGWGRIVTSTSSGVISPIPNLGVSNAIRSSLVGWSKTLAGEVAAFGVTSNVILPGRVATKRIDFLDAKKAEREGKTVENIVADSLSDIPAGRYGTPREYGDVTAFLASDAASYVTGSIIRVDGGYVSSI